MKKFTDDERAKLLDQSVQEVSAGRFLVEASLCYSSNALLYE